SRWSLDGVRLAWRAGHAGEDACEPWTVGCAEQPVEPSALDVLGGVAEKTLDRGALVRDRAVCCEHGDQVARMGDERAEPRLALTAVEILGEQRPLDRQ